MCGSVTGTWFSTRHMSKSMSVSILFYEFHTNTLRTKGVKLTDGESL